MKANNLQKEALNALIDVFKSGINTNDIDSPSHENFIEDTLGDLNLPDNIYYKLIDKAKEIFSIVQSIYEDPI